jgi:ubiquinone/menaquinone biosynthesis C-methylase UbiE
LIFKPFAEGFGLEWVDNTFAPQSLVFYSQILPIIYQSSLYIRSKGKEVVNILDIGSASGAGPNLMNNVLNNLSGIKTNVTAIDIEERFLTYSKNRFPSLQYLIGDVFQHDFPSVDILTISHTLEHVENPIAFIDELRKKFPKTIQIYYVPWKEKELIPDHKTSFDEKIMMKIQGLLYAKIFRSICWRTENTSQVLAFVVIGNEVLNKKSEKKRLCRKFEDEFSSKTAFFAGSKISRRLNLEFRK